MSEDDELVQVFLEESRENLGQLDLDLVELESRPQDQELLAQIFRTIHTIKGTCGFLGYVRLEALAHAGEDLLAALRAGELHLDEGITTSLLGLVDEIRTVLDVVDATAAEADDDHSAVIADLLRHLAPVPTSEEPRAGQALAAGEAVEPGGPAPQAPADSAPDPGPTPEAPAPAASTHEDATVRVDVTVLDKLQDLVGELTLARIQVGDHLTETDEAAAPFHQLTRVTRELQDTVMLARLQPVGTVIGKLRRVVRDLARAQGKQIRVDLSGEDVGVDKAINEILRDPLMHLVRNSVDHGIEPPDERVRSGKPAQARLRVEATLTGGRVQIDVADDGRGIDVDRLSERAVATGLLTPEEVGTLSDDKRLDLIFRPGLSASREVTKVSGRGVGMDVVRSSIEHVGGSVEVRSQRGRGTLIRLNVPLTLAIIHAVIVHCGTGRYAVPQVDIHAIARVEPDDMVHRIDDIEGVRFLRREGRLLPLVDLASALGVEAAPRLAGLEIVIIESLDRTYGLIVDHVADNVEAVVKPLPRAIRGTVGFGGVTILADGRPSLILDAVALAHHVAAERSSVEPLEGSRADTRVPTQLLVASGAGGGRWAVPADAVSRLERFPVERVEHSGHVEVIQYRDSVMPLLRVGHYVDDDYSGLAEPAEGAGGVLDVVVCDTDSGLVGLVVAAIEEIAPRPAAEPEDDGRAGVSGRLVVGERVTDLLDVEALVILAGLGRSQ